MKSFRALYPWIITAASLRSSSPDRTSAMRVFISSLRLATSLLDRPLPPREAALRRLSALAGSWAQQSPCGPVAVPLQRSPFGLIKLHWRPNGATPFFEAIPALPAGPGGVLRGQRALRQAALEDGPDAPGFADLLVGRRVGLPHPVF